MTEVMTSLPTSLLIYLAIELMDMDRDVTAFKRRFNDYKNGKSINEIYDAGRPIAIQEVDKSDADFAKRLRSNWRLEIWDWEGSGKSVTHKIAGDGNIVYPNVLTTKGGGLIDFTNPIWQGNVDPLLRAIKNNDYVPMKTEQDAIWFGPNYKDYYPGFKNGKLPKYSTGTESWLPDYTMDYILALENPTRQGFNDGVWRPPTDSSKWDTHAIGGGLDIRYENNPLVYNFLSKNGRLNDPYLTEQEETDLRWLIFNRDMLPILSKVHDKYGEQISPKGYARLAGMKWQGHPFLMAITPDSITGKAFLNAITSGDRDLDSVFDTYYLYPANAKKYASRIQSDKDYWKDTKLERTKYNIPEPTIKRHVEVPDRTAVRNTVSKSKTRARWSGAEEVSPYITGKPMVKLQKQIKLPSVIEENKKSQWKAPMQFKDGKLPGYEDGKSIIDFIKNKLYTNVTPVDYDIPKAILEFFSGEREYQPGVKEALWAKYLGRNTYTDYAGEKNVNDVIVPAIYSPTKGESTYTAYRINPDIFDYSHSGTAGGPLSNENIKAYFEYRNKTGKNNFTVDTKNGFTGDGNAGMGYYTMGSGQDEKGRYISYYDDWDINPFHGNTARSWTKILPSWIKDKGDILQGILDTKPFTLYDRRYLTDEEWKSLGGYKNGKLPMFRNGKSSIHINPANRGKFNATKKRTGKTTEQLAHSSNPLTRKRAIFALNARKWHH